MPTDDGAEIVPANGTEMKANDSSMQLDTNDYDFMMDDDSDEAPSYSNGKSANAFRAAYKSVYRYRCEIPYVDVAARCIFFNGATAKCVTATTPSRSAC